MSAQIASFQQVPLVKMIDRALRERCDVRAGDRIVIAVSGGADSLALLLALRAIAPRRQWLLDPHVAHVNHHLRPEADEEARFVRNLCQSLDLPFHLREVDVPGAVARSEVAERNVESAARRLRYEALCDVARQVDADHVATAHHADDQLETVLMRLMRGAGVAGLASLAWSRHLANVHLIRPMLNCTHAQAIDFLKSAGQTWCEDATNKDESRLRSRLRARVIPELKAIEPRITANTQRTTEHLRQADGVLKRRARRIAARQVRQLDAHRAEMDRSAARRIPEALLNIIVRQQVIRFGAVADALKARVVQPILNAIYDQVGGKRTFDLAGHVRVLVTSNAVHFEKLAATTRLHRPPTDSL